MADVKEITAKLEQGVKALFESDRYQQYLSFMGKFHDCTVLDGNVDGYEELIKKLEAVSPLPVFYEEINGGANGFCSYSESKIVVKQGMSQLQTVKTLVHEISHAMLHGVDGAEHEADKRTCEVQAESIAYTVCQMLGLDSSEYSFGYVVEWSGDKDAKQLTASMEVIRKTANQIMEGLK